MRHRKTWLVGVCLFALGGCSDGTVQRQVCGPFDTCVEVQIIGDDTASARRGLDTLFADLDRLDAIIQPGRSKGLRRMNALLQTQEWASINPSLYKLVRDSMGFYQASEGLYNPAIMGALLELWGFDRTPLPKQPPAPEEIEAVLRARARMSDLSLDGIRIRSNNALVKIDFGTLTHGHAVDIAIAYLQSLGIRQARVQIGNTARVLGQGRHGRWQLTAPRLLPGNGALTFYLQDGEAACSLRADDRYLEHAGQRYHDLLHPETGRPATASRAVAVIHGSATEASAACHALFAAGPASWRRIGSQMRVKDALLTAADGTVHAPAALAKRLVAPLPDAAQVQWAP